ncbi:MAG TPA: transposase [Verrucomicrobiae bacterium]|nr:transposase [Verrucomicrobiae bacterium]
MTPRTKREYLHGLVSDKNRWSRPLTGEERKLGFLGWHERGYLPHCDFPGLIQFVTFRLADSMPASRRGEWEHLLKIEEARQRRAKLEEYLDRGIGECNLHDTGIAGIAEQALLYFHDDRYELLAWCVMPNHVHVLVNVRTTPLWKMMQSWKRFISTHAETILSERRSPARLLGEPNRNAPARRAALQTLRWQREYWDTFMRDEEQKRKAIRYIENNPVKARLCQRAKEWPFSSARLRDDNERLAIF